MSITSSFNNNLVKRMAAEASASSADTIFSSPVESILQPETTRHFNDMSWPGWGWALGGGEFRARETIAWDQLSVSVSQCQVWHYLLLIGLSLLTIQSLIGQEDEGRGQHSSSNSEEWYQDWQEQSVRVEKWELSERTMLKYPHLPVNEYNLLLKYNLLLQFVMVSIVNEWTFISVLKARKIYYNQMTIGVKRQVEDLL